MVVIYTPLGQNFSFKELRQDTFQGSWLKINESFVLKFLKGCVHVTKRIRKHIETYCDETWLHHYTPETKTASKEWRQKGESCRVKSKDCLSAGKVLETVFWNYRGVLLVDLLPLGEPLKPYYYYNFWSVFESTIGPKRQVLLWQRARSHATAGTQEKLAEMQWSVVEHPAYVHTFRRVIITYLGY